MFADLTDGEEQVLRIAAGIFAILATVALAIVMIASGVEVVLAAITVFVPFVFGIVLIGRRVFSLV
jgi:hypothetical protein